MVPALTYSRSLEHRLQSLQSGNWLGRGQEDADTCHLFPFVRKGSAIPFFQIQLLEPEHGTVQLPTSQPEPDLIDRSEQGTYMQIDMLIHVHTDLFKPF